jgi:hypothetical protein
MKPARKMNLNVQKSKLKKNSATPAIISSGKQFSDQIRCNAGLRVCGFRVLGGTKNG